MNFIGCDLDKTLAKYESGDYHKYGATFIGDPIPEMVERIKGHLIEGKIVKIYTARVAGEYNSEVEKAIQDWTEKHLGVRLEVTNVKTMDMDFCYDDRCIQVIPNTGKLVR